MISLFLILLFIAPNAQAYFQLKTLIGTTNYCLSSASSQGQILALLTSDMTQCLTIITSASANNVVVVDNAVTAQTIGSLQCDATAPCYWNTAVIVAYNVLFQNALNGVGQPSGLYQLNLEQDPLNLNQTSKCLFTSGSAPYQLVMSVPTLNALNGVNNCLEFSAASIISSSSTTDISTVQTVQPTTNSVSVTASTTSSTLTTSPTSAAYGSQITLFMILVIGLLFIF